MGELNLAIAEQSTVQLYKEGCNQNLVDNFKKGRELSIRGLKEGNYHLIIDRQLIILFVLKGEVFQLNGLNIQMEDSL